MSDTIASDQTPSFNTEDSQSKPNRWVAWPSLNLPDRTLASDVILGLSLSGLLSVGTPGPIELIQVEESALVRCSRTDTGRSGSYSERLARFA